MDQGRKDDIVHAGSALADGFELAQQRMRGIDCVVPVSTDHHQVLHIRLLQQVLEQIERRRVEPLQVVEEQRQRVLRPREHTDKTAEHKLKAMLCFLGWKFGNWWLLSDDELQFRNQIHNELPVPTEGITKGITPFVQLLFALAQQGTDKVLKGLRERGIRNVALKLIELPRSKKATGRNKWFVELID